MLTVTLDKTNAIAVLVPHGALSADDFKHVASVIAPYLSQTAKKLNGIVIHAERFPGWDSFAAFSSHLRFVRGHEKEIARIALSTDMEVARLVTSIAQHFIKAQIKVFSYADFAQAQAWAAGK